MSKKLSYEKIEKFFLKNNKTLFLLFLILSIFAAIPCFITDIYVDKDLTFHIYRIQELANNIKAGYILPAPQFNNIFGYGYMVDIFYPSLFLYPFALLTIITGISAFTAFKISVVCINLVTFYTSKYAFSQILQNKNNVVLISIFYTLFPYRILNLVFNGFYGEYYALIFVPLVICGMYSVIKYGKWKMLTIGMIGIVYSHILTLLTITAFLFIIFLFNIKKIISNKRIIPLIKASIVTIFCSLAFIVPLINYMRSDVFKYTYNNEMSDIKAVGPYIPLWISIPNQIIIIFIMIKFYKKNKGKNNNLITIITLSIIYSLIMQTYLFPWHLFDYLPGFSSLQFAMRILNIFIPLYAYLLLDTVKLYPKLKSTFIILLTGFIIFSISFGGQALNKYNGEEIKNIPNYNEKYENNTNFKKNTFLDIIASEYVPYDFKINGKELVEITNDDIINYRKLHLSNNVTILNYTENPGNIILELNTSKPTNIEFPITYYKNYKAYKDGEEIPIFHDNGLIYLKNIDSGTIEIKYEISKDQKYTAIISSITFIIFIIYCILSLTKTRKNGKII